MSKRKKIFIAIVLLFLYLSVIKLTLGQLLDIGIIKCMILTGFTIITGTVVGIGVAGSLIIIVFPFLSINKKKWKKNRIDFL